MFYLAAHFTLLHIATLHPLPKSPHLLTVVESRTEMANAVELCGNVWSSTAVASHATEQYKSAKNTQVVIPTLCALKQPLVPLAAI